MKYVVELTDSELLLVRSMVLCESSALFLADDIDLSKLYDKIYDALLNAVEVE